jgi:chromosomal replication initiation ATPase DnaA
MDKVRGVHFLDLIKSKQTYTDLTILRSIEKYIISKEYAPEDYLLSKKKPMKIMVWRQLTAYLTYRYCKLNVTTLSEYVGKDHTTILYTFRTVQDLIELQHPDIYPKFLELSGLFDKVFPVVHEKYIPKNKPQNDAAKRRKLSR